MARPAPGSEWNCLEELDAVRIDPHFGVGGPSLFE
jgi:hypothetical protein